MLENRLEELEGGQLDGVLRNRPDEVHSISLEKPEDSLSLKNSLQYSRIIVLPVFLVVLLDLIGLGKLDESL